MPRQCGKESVRPTDSLASSSAPRSARVDGGSGLVTTLGGEIARTGSTCSGRRQRDERGNGARARSRAGRLTALTRGRLSSTRGTARTTKGDAVPDTITHHRRSDREEGHRPDHERHVPVVRAARARSRPPPVRPRLPVDGGLRSRHHLPRRRRRHPALPRLPHRAAGRAVDLPRGGLPAAERRAAEQGSSSTSGPSTSPTTPSSTTTCASASWRASTTTPTRWACSCRASPRCRPTTPRPRTSSTPENRDKQILRLIAKMPTLAAYCHRFSVGMPTVFPDNDALLHRQLPQHDVEGRRVRGRPGPRARPRRPVHPPRRPRAELRHHGDARRRLGPGRSVHRRPRPPPRRSTARCTAGANEQVVRMLTEIGSIDNVPAFIETVKAGKGRLMGFGHRVYKNYDPRATIIKQTADEVFEVTGQEPAARHRPEARRGGAAATTTSSPASSTRTSTSTRASSTRPWASRSRCSRCCSPSPARRAGWRTGQELLGDKDQKIARPRQAYIGRRPARLRRGDRPDLIRPEPIRPELSGASGPPWALHRLRRRRRGAPRFGAPAPRGAGASRRPRPAAAWPRRRRRARARHAASAAVVVAGRGLQALGGRVAGHRCRVPPSTPTGHRPRR